MARPHPALVELAAGRTMPPVADIGSFLSSTREHRMTGLVWDLIETGDFPVPEATRDDLEQVTLQIWGHHVRLWDVLERVVTRFAEAGIEVGTAKGVTAEARWYDQLGHRPSADLDLFIDPGHGDRVAEIITLLDADVDARPVGAAAQAGLLQAVNLDVEGINVDLHFDILKMGVATRQLALVWERTLPFELKGGGSVRVLDPELALIHFLVHLNRSKFQRLLQYVDVIRIMEREDLDWDFIDRFTRGEGIDVPLRCSLTAVLEDLDRMDLDPPWRPPLGWRAGVWVRVWPPQNRLLGEAAFYRFAQRGKTLLPLLYPGRVAEALRWRASLVFPPRAVLDVTHGRASGPYLKRLILGRWRYTRMRWSGRKKTRTGIPR